MKSYSLVSVIRNCLDVHFVSVNKEFIWTILCICPGLRLSAANVIFTYTLFYVPETCTIFGCDSNCHVGVTCIIKTVERQNIIRNTEAQEKWNDGGASKSTRRAVGGCEGAKPRK